MAEFKDVMRQRKRLCKLSKCDECLLSSLKTHVAKECHRFTIENYEEAEKIIMDWAAERPEPAYPTWEEWQRNEFPNFYVPIKPCAFMSKDESKCTEHVCVVCRNTPIPAEIAEKLNIKPKEAMNK